jgi:iron-sulfur cluster insertion protein
MKITDQAFSQIKLISERSNKEPVLRISVEGGGCSGFMYNYEFITKASIETDDYIQAIDNIFVVIDNMSLEFLKDSIFDYEESLTSSSFKISNPTATIKCGCGKSFAV